MRNALLAVVCLYLPQACRSSTDPTNTVNVVEVRGELIVVHLQRAHCDEIVGILHGLLQASRSRPPATGFCALPQPGATAKVELVEVAIAAEPATNSVLIKCSEEDTPRIVELILRLDDSFVGHRGG